jgi:hypothetical protein
MRNTTIILFTTYYLKDETCKHGEDNVYKILIAKIKREGTTWNTYDVDVQPILKWTLIRQYVTMWTRFIRLRTEHGGDSYDLSNETLIST